MSSRTYKTKMDKQAEAAIKRLEEAKKKESLRTGDLQDPTN